MIAAGVVADREPRPALADALAAATRELQLQLEGDQTEKLLEFVSLLQRWNRTYNLTSIRDPVQMMTQHVVDCLAAVTPLRRHLRASGALRVLDVGSGAGLPGVVFAVTQPQAQVTCVDSVGKKAAFIRQAATTLGLANLEARHSRVEDLAGIEPFDVVASRAFGSLATLVDLTTPAIADRGVWMAMKGKTPSGEVAQLPPKVVVFHVEPLSVPGLDAERCLVWMRSLPGSDATASLESVHTLSMSVAPGSLER